MLNVAADPIMDKDPMSCFGISAERLHIMAHHSRTPYSQTGRSQGHGPDIPQVPPISKSSDFLFVSEIPNSEADTPTPKDYGAVSHGAGLWRSMRKGPLPHLGKKKKTHRREKAHVLINIRKP